MVSFAVKIDTEADYDFLYFMVDGEELAEWSGSEDWAEVEFNVSAGSHTLEWNYEKDYIVSDGEDAVWVDDIILPAFCYIDVYIISSQGEGVLCPGTTATLSTESGYNTLWSTEETSTSIEVSEASCK